MRIVLHFFIKESTRYFHVWIDTIFIIIINNNMIAWKHWTGRTGTIYHTLHVFNVLSTFKHYFTQNMMFSNVKIYNFHSNVKEIKKISVKLTVLFVRNYILPTLTTYFLFHTFSSTETIGMQYLSTHFYYYVDTNIVIIRKLYSLRFLCRLTAFFSDLLEPWDVRELYIRKTPDLPLQLYVDTFPRFVAIGFYFLSETLI